MENNINTLESLNYPVNLGLLAKIAGMNKETLKYWVKGGILKPIFVETRMKRNINYFTLKDALLLIILRHLIFSLGIRSMSMKTISFWIKQKADLIQMDNYYCFMNKENFKLFHKIKEKNVDLNKKIHKLINLDGKNHCILDEISQRLRTNKGKLKGIYMAILLPNKAGLMDNSIDTNFKVIENSIMFYLSRSTLEIKMDLLQKYFPQNTNVSLIVNLKPVAEYLDLQIKKYKQDLEKISKKINEKEMIKRIII
jgi:DNA-binding transcriptional MerR regulator